MSHDWDAYFADTDDGPVSFFVDLAARPNADGTERPLLCRVTVTLLSPSEYGLSTRAEDETLFELEDSIEEGLGSACGALFVGRSTHAGQRLFFFYLPERGSVNSALEKVFSKAPQYRWKHVLEHDADWTHYFEFLYPGAEEMQVIQNRRVLNNLEKHGATLKAPRPVEHWIYFPTRASRDRFKASIAGKGFRIEDESKDRDQWKLRISRSDHVDPDSINEVTLELFRLAQEVEGDYSGWETEVIRQVQ